MALGPAEYRLFIAKRGGVPIAQLPWRSISWARSLDNMSSGSGSVPISRPDHPQAWAVAGAEAWVHELVIERGADGAIWAGPLLQPKWTSTGVELSARDLFQWFERRSLLRNRKLTGDLAYIFSVMVSDALVEDDSPGIFVQPAATTITGTRVVRGAERKRAADALRELASTGLDFTVIGREILTGGEEVPVKRLSPITNEMLRNPELTGAGEALASRTVVIGQRQGSTGAGQPVTGIAGGVSPTTGLVERVFNESAIGDAGSAAQAAKTRLDALGRMPLYLTGELDPLRAPPISLLIPGAIAPIEVTVGCRQVLEDMRLTDVQGTVNVSDQGGVAEQIRVSFAPVGTQLTAAAG